MATKAVTKPTPIRSKKKTSTINYQLIVDKVCEFAGIKQADVVFTDYSALDIRGVFAKPEETGIRVIIPQKAFDRISRYLSVHTHNTIYEENFVQIAIGEEDSPDTILVNLTAPYNDDHTEIVDGYVVESLKATYYDLLAHQRVKRTGDIEAINVLADLLDL
jgi:hypothetical protein